MHGWGVGCLLQTGVLEVEEEMNEVEEDMNEVVVTPPAHHHLSCLVIASNHAPTETHEARAVACVAAGDVTSSGELADAQLGSFSCVSDPACGHTSHSKARWTPSMTGHWR